MSGKTYFKKNAALANYLSKKKIPAQFVAQPSKYVQRVRAVGKVTDIKISEKFPFLSKMKLTKEEDEALRLKLGEEKERVMPMLLRRESGKVISQADRNWLYKNRIDITKEFAKAIAELNLKYGVAHRDLGMSNVVIRKNSAGKPVIRIIDFEHSIGTEKEASSVRERKKSELPGDTNSLVSEFISAEMTVNALGKSSEEKKALWKLFVREYEKEADKIMS